MLSSEVFIISVWSTSIEDKYKEIHTFLFLTGFQFSGHSVKFGSIFSH